MSQTKVSHHVMTRELLEKLNDEQIDELIRLSQQEALDGSVKGHGGPFGALVVEVHSGEVVSSAHNEVLLQSDPTCHAETLAIRRACQLRKSPHLEDCVVIASSEPCPMCLTVGYWAKIKGMIYCSPVEVAAEAGFSDSFIYEELNRPVAERKLLLQEWPNLQAEGKDVFAQWQAKQGKLY